MARPRAAAVNISDEQLHRLSDIADEMERLPLAAQKVGSPPAARILRLERALPELAALQRVLIQEVRSGRGEAVRV